MKNKLAYLLLLIPLVLAGAFYTVNKQEEQVAPPPAETSVTTEIVPPLPKPTLSANMQTLFELTNQERETELTLSAELTQTAQRKCDDMQARNYFSHEDPEGLTPGMLIPAILELPATAIVGENLARGFGGDPYVIHQGWMSSPGHRENILYAEFNFIGIAECNGRQGYLAVQHFASEGVQ